jgi:uncharacterized protein (TIGR00369 family)
MLKSHKPMDTDRFEFLKKDYLQGFPAFCGFSVEDVAHGEFITRLAVSENHRQQDGFVHAGVIATMADHTAGYAAYTTVESDYRILTVEFKINYLRPAAGPVIQCRGTVISMGKKIIVSESEVYSGDVAVGNSSDSEGKLVSKAMVTLMVVSASSLQPSS